MPTKYYKVSINPAPEVLQIGHATAAAGTTQQFTASNPKQCRICCIQSGEIIETAGNETRVYKAGTVFSLFCDHEAVHTASQSLKTFQFSLIFANPPIPMTEEEVAHWTPAFHEVIIPDHITDPVVCQEASALIRAVVSARRSGDALFSLRCRAVIHQLYLLLTEHSIKQTQTLKSGTKLRENRYCLRARQYITSHLHEKISVADVAEAVGISYNYLNRLFTSHHGITMVEYIHREKMHQVEKLLLETDIPLEEAGIRVGITDVKYLSRLFRRYTGMTLTEYRRISRKEAR